MIWHTPPFPDPAPRMNANDPTPNSKWAAIARRRDVTAWREAGYLAARMRRRPHITGRATVTVWFGTDRPNQRRDPMNWYPTVKALIDGLTQAKLWPDDDAAHVLVAQPVFTADVRPKHFVIHVEWTNTEETS